MATPDQLMDLLSKHIGKGNGIRVKRLAIELDVEERQARKMISDLREEGNAICGTPRDGYYIAGTPDELEATCALLEKRVMHGLRIISRLRKIPMPDLLGQLHLPT